MAHTEEERQRLVELGAKAGVTIAALRTKLREAQERIKWLEEHPVARPDSSLVSKLGADIRDLETERGAAIERGRFLWMMARIWWELLWAETQQSVAAERDAEAKGALAKAGREMLETVMGWIPPNARDEHAVQITRLVKDTIARTPTQEEAPE